MTIDYLIEQLNYLKKDVITGEDIKITSIHKTPAMIQMSFSNGVITQIMEPSKHDWTLYNLKG